ncbi:zinc finger protein 626 [Bicyclus anynana]|uniref:Zinc finger protein 626 n=1 Tax=Bicyclus anynana TaxID=110368 RepID=A0ABM3M4G5_BICAN|nr:zinc finger protein 626 [Bicyclus anynana]
MWCSVPLCENSRENKLLKTNPKSLEITYHGFPTIQWLKYSWLVSLGMEESQLLEPAMVCSEHFHHDDFVMGTQRLKSDALPSVVQVCIICLDTDTKLYPLAKYNLSEAYYNVTGISLCSKLKLSPKLCVECAHRLVSCNKFRDKSVRAHNLLLQLYERHNVLSTQNVKTINREENKLTSNIRKKTFMPDHYDYNYTYTEEKQMHPLQIEKIVISVDTTTEVKIETENDDGLKEELSNENFDSDEDDIDNVDMTDNKGVEVIKIDRDNIEDFINNDVFTDVEFPNVDNCDADIDFMDEDDNLKLSSIIKSSKSKISKINKKKLSKDVKVKVKKDGKKRVKSEVRGRPGRKPGFKEELKLFKVTELSHEEQIAEIQKRQETSNYKNSPFKCTTCYKGFCDINAYNRHMDKHTNKFGQFACPICGLHTKNPYRVNKHLGNTHAARYSCTICPFVTRSRNSAKAHERWHDGKKYKCPHCDEEFIKSTSYMSHVRIKHPSDFVCTLCGFSFIGERGLRMHLNMKHRFDDIQNPLGPVCEECNIRFASDAAYHQHMKVSPKHATADTFKLNYPVRKVCRNQARPAKPAKREPAAPPKPIGPVDCEQCGIKLKGSRSYAMHFKKYHPDKNRTKFPKARIMCELCGKIFTCMAHLRYHMPIHAEQKQFKCDVCDKRFAFKANLMNHVVIHDETRPRFECAVCGKNFSNQQNRWRHMFVSIIM